MNYIAAITTLFQCSSHRLSERSKVLDVDFDFAVTSLPKYEQITELIESFPQRDIVTLSLINENDDLFYMSSQDLSLQQKFDTFKTDCKYSEQLSAKISINKSVQDGNISIYDFSSFAQGLCDLPLEGILSTFSALLSEANQLTFEVFDKEVLSKTGDYVTSLLDDFKKNLIAILGFLFTVILANVVSDQPLDNIFTRDITLILEAVLLGSVVYLIICISEAKYKVKKVQDSYDALKTNYSSLLTSEDIAQAFGNDKLITKMVNEVNRGIIRYSLLWGLFILFFLVAIEIISTEPFVTPLLQHLFTTIKNILLQTTCN